MAVFNPTLNFPVNVGINGAVDNTFAWTFNKDADDTSVQTDYQLVAYNLSNTIIYDSTKLSGDATTQIVPASTFTNGTVYKARVDVYVGAEKFSSRYVTFTAESVPTLNVDTLPSPFEHQFYTFTATYTQSENILIKTSKWRWYDNLDELIFETPDLAGDILSYEFEGFDNNTTYKVEVEVTNQSDVTTISPRLTFTTDYIIPDGTPEIVTTPRNCEGSITVGWQNLIIQNGTLDGVGTYVTGKFNLGLQLTGCVNYSFANELPEDFAMTIWVKLPTGFSGDIIRFYKNNELAYRIGYDNNFGNMFYYERDYRTVGSRIISLPTDFFLLGITSDRIYYTIDGIDYEVY